MSSSDKTTATDRLGRQLAQALATRADQVEPDVSARLATARQAALQAAQEARLAPQLALQAAVAGQAPVGGPRSRWSRLLPAASLLLVGFIAIAHSQWLQDALGLADRDAAVLKDHLPPNAYGDPGFNEYLDEKSDADSPKPDEEEAKP